LLLGWRETADTEINRHGTPDNVGKAKGESMTIRKLTIAAVLVVCWSGIALAQDLAAIAKPEQLGFSPGRLQRLTETYQGYVDRGELPGAVLVIARDDKPAYVEAIGYQDREKKIAMKKDAIFRLASMTKPIVSVAAMMLVEEGKLDLLDPVAKYLPEFKEVKVGVEQTDPATGKPGLRLDAPHRAMTVQDLMRHTSDWSTANSAMGWYTRPIARQRSWIAIKAWRSWWPSWRSYHSRINRAKSGNTACPSTCSGG
jgi:CubicO group peptidase (beta-lactamase class C family)